MGRYKKLEIQGLLVEDFGRILLYSIDNIIKNSGLSEEQVLKKIAPNFEKLLEDYEDSVASLYVEKHKFNLDAFLKTHFNNQKKIAKAHHESFVGFILYINGCYVIYDKIIEKVKRKKVDSTLKMTIAIYGLIIRRADEILTQLLCGYIDAAMILWRSLYENAIILLVLAFQNNSELADKYFRHSIRNSKRKILSYQKNHRALKFKALPKKTEQVLQSEIDALNALYGKEFLDNEYGWADDLFPGKQRANFMLLEELVDMSRFRPYYIICSEQIHANFNGFKRFMEGSKIILPRLVSQQLEFEAFVDPMQFTVSVMHEVNEYILYEFSVEDEYKVNVLLMRKVFEKQQNTFARPKRKRANS